MIREHGVRVAARCRGWLDALARLLPVQDCLLCRGYSKGALLCAFCRRSLPRCAQNLDRHKAARALGLDALAVRFDYREPLSGLIARYKYHGELALAPVLARLLPRPPSGARQALLLPVPTDARRLRGRGFDPMTLVATAYARRHRLRLSFAQRTRAAAAQAGLGRQRRAANLCGAFRVDQALEAEMVLLLDDVLTTGATLRELAKACRSQRAAWVGAVVLARTPGCTELRPDG